MIHHRRDTPEQTTRGAIFVTKITCKSVCILLSSDFVGLTILIGVRAFSNIRPPMVWLRHNTRYPLNQAARLELLIVDEACHMVPAAAIILTAWVY